VPSLTADRGVEFAALNVDHNGDSQIDLTEFDRSPVVIMFSPSGAIERYVVQNRSYFPVGTVHLLMGNTAGQERAAGPLPWSAADNSVYVSDLLGRGHSKNVESPESVWISIGHRTGVVGSTANGWSPTPFLTSSLRLAREFAQSGQAAGSGR
jgi:hypothetical protein